MDFHIVTGKSTIPFFNFFRYFKTNLGIVSTVDKDGSGTRVLNDKDRFAFYFNSLYKTTIYGSGNVGDVKFYYDLYINDNTVAVYIGDGGEYDEFIYKFERTTFDDKGVDNYIGYLLKESETEYANRQEEQKIQREAPKPIGSSEKLMVNPGSVRYEDIQAYLDEQRNKRFDN